MSQYLAYVQQFDIQSNSTVDPITHMHVLKHSMRMRDIAMGDILPLDQLRSYTHIILKFGKKADPQLTSFNSLHFSDTFYLNKYFNKDFFYAVST